MILTPLDSAIKIKQHSRKLLRKKKSNALIPKQKIENAITRTFLKKNYPKKGVSGQKQRCIQTLAVSKETQQS